MQERLQRLNYYKWLVFGVTAIGTFMATLDSSIVNVALPIIAQDLNSDLVMIQWVVTAYLLTTSSSLPIFGRLGDIIDRRKLYGYGFLVFTAGSLFCAWASNVWLLIFARVVQALGASIMMSNAPAVITTIFPHKQRGQALGMVGTFVALGSMTGPSIGGALVGFFGWHSIFLINLPIGIFGYICSRIVLPQSKPSTKAPFDYWGSFLFTVAMVSLLLGISNGQAWGWISGKIFATVVATIAGFSLFIWQERRIEHPLLNLNLFKNWTFFAGNLSGMLSFMAVFSNTLLLPFYLHTVLNLTPERIGLTLTAFPVTMAIVAPISGYLSDRIGPGILTVSGMSLIMGSLMYLSSLGAQTPLWKIIATLAVMGCGNGMFQSPNNSSVMSSVHVSQHGVAGSMTALVRNVGMVCGTAIAVTIFNLKQAQVLAGLALVTPEAKLNAFMYGYHYALAVGAGFAGLGAILSIQRLRRHSRKNNK